MSCPHIRQLAKLTQDGQDGRLLCRVIDARMKALKSAGRQRWDNSRKRYVVEGC